MEYIQATKQLKQHRLYKEYKELTHQYYLHSIRQEEKTNRYLNNQSVKNKITGEVFDLSYDFEKEEKKAKNRMIQKIIHIEKTAKDNRLQPLFLTFTLPSQYHPFISIGKKKNRLYVDTNKNFFYRTITNAITAGYEQLNKLFRAFYRQIKRYKFGNMMQYIKVYEPHSSLQVHLHALFFVHPSQMKNIISYFKKFLEKQEIGRSELDANIVSDINRVASYISKYIYKNVSNDNDQYFKRFLDGWKKKNKIRMISTSNVKINMILYKKLYSALPKDLKKEMLAISEYNKQTLLTTLLENTEFNQRTLINGVSQGTSKTKNKTSKFIIKYDKVVKVKQAQRSSTVRKKAIRIYHKDEIDKDDGFMETQRYNYPFLDEEYLSFLGYITYKEIYEDIVKITAIQNIRIYYKNQKLYSQNDFTVIKN